MTSNKPQPSVRNERRIIERPRLLGELDGSSARVILLLAPAGYGKTTLARQWAKTLSRAVWITCSPAHRDVAALAEDLANGIDRLEGDTTQFVKQLLTAHRSPQRVSRRIATALARRLEAANVHWLLIDDYHELSGSAEAEQFVELLQEGTTARLIVSSRQRPQWARSRRVVYGELHEIGRDKLAMTDQESLQLLGRRAASVALRKQAEGWPAVLALAAAADHASPPTEALPSALHRFFAEELYQRATSQLQDQLLNLALLPRLHGRDVNPEIGSTIEQATELGFVSGEEAPDLHPLLREFLLQKLSERPDGNERVRDSIVRCTQLGEWDGALRLLTRFSCDDLVEPVLCQAFKPLVLGGRLETLSSFAAAFRAAPAFPPPSIDVVEAEAAHRDGNLELAADLAARALETLPDTHALRSRAAAIDGHSNFQLSRFDEAEQAFLEAKRTAFDEQDETEALHGLALARIFGERGDADSVVSELWRRRHTSPAHLLRAAAAELSHRRLNGGLAQPLSLDEPLHACSQVGDPRARTSFFYAASYALAQRGEYRSAELWLNRFLADIREYDLEFAKPHAAWTGALIRLGLRQFGEAERLLQSLEDAAAARSDAGHALNARILRARLLLQTGKHEDAVALTSSEPPTEVYPSWRGEYSATRAMALAATGEANRAADEARIALATSRMAEVRMLAAAAIAISAADAGDFDAAAKLLVEGATLGVWDPVVCALRTSATLSQGLAREKQWRTLLESLYEASNDLGLARRAGFRTRSTRSPAQLLTPRELEVLGLIARGMRNAEIAKALFIAPSTAKTHVCHVLAKLGVRTRAQAAGRLEMFS